MANDATELVIAKGGAVKVAPTGTALPTIPSGATAGFVDLGYVSENGVTLAITPDIAEFPAWQTRHPVRRELNGQEIMASFELEQWNAVNITLAFGGGAVTSPSAGVYRYDFPTDNDQIDVRALCIDWKDGVRSFRAVFPQGNVTEPVSSTLVRNALGMLPVGFKVLGADGVVPGYILSDDPTFGIAS